MFARDDLNEITRDLDCINLEAATSADTREWRVEESGGEWRCPVNAVVMITVARTTSSYLSLGHTTQPPNVSKLFAVHKMRI